MEHRWGQYPTAMLRRVLEHYDLRNVTSTEPLGGAGGFSGANLWRLTTTSETGAVPWCLRQWPETHPTESRLREIHAFLQGLSDRGVRVPCPQTTQRGATFVRQHGTWWELTPWLPGEASYLKNPTEIRLQAAVEALAELHLASAQWQSPQHGPSPALKQRFAMLANVADLAAAVQQRWRRIPHAMRGAAEPILRLAPSAARAVHQRFADSQRSVLLLQWVVRDIWHDHILFENGTDPHVSGIVDFGAASRDTVATDLARLLGSLVQDDGQGWSTALAAYDALRPLAGPERDAVRALDQAAVVLSGMNWLKWIAVEGREFPGREFDIAERLEAIRERLVRL